MAVNEGRSTGISRRGLLVGGGAGVGLLVAWALWPRIYDVALQEGEGEHGIGAFIKIAKSGTVTVIVPQAEIGQGVFTSLAQIVADELGADWRRVGVEPAPIAGIYANDVLAAQWSGAMLPAWVRAGADWWPGEYARRNRLMFTGGSTSVRAFEPRLREAGAAARSLLMKAAGERWAVDWESLTTSGGFVMGQGKRLAFGGLAEAAAGMELPDAPVPLRTGGDKRLTGKPLPRIDGPAKADGSILFAGDIRLPDMVFASVRAGPVGDSRLASIEREVADAVPGVLAVFESERWAAAAATNWWAADRALDAMKPVFETRGGLVDDAAVEEALSAALEEGEGKRAFGRGEPEQALSSGTLFRAHYGVGPAPTAALEPLTATARLTGDRLELWAPVQAPTLARAAAARAIGLAEGQVTLYPTVIGGGYGRKAEVDAVVQAAIIAERIGKPVQLTWSRFEESVQDGFRPPARAVLTARMEGGRLLAWQARIAAPSALVPLFDRLDGGNRSTSSVDAVDGAVPPYAIASVAVDHVPGDVPIRTGYWRSGAHSTTCFFTESFVDELARKAGIEPLSFRMQMLGDNPRLAQVLQTAAAMGGWDGGGEGSAMGLAVHSAFGSHIALLVEVAIGAAQRVRVTRAVAAVDCGRVVNPDILRQVIEGGIIHGISGATGAVVSFAEGLPNLRRLGAMNLVGLADAPDILVEIVQSDEPPGGASELGVPPVAPAIANALFAATGQRLRALPLIPGSVA